MRCAWQAYLNLLPIWMRTEVDKLGRNGLQELRLRIHTAPELIINGKSVWLERKVSKDDLKFCVNISSQYSPWAAATAAQGYITAPGGHRVGLCGEAIIINEKMNGISIPTSLCLRVARDFPGIADKAAKVTGSVLLLGAPGCGKTTLLRDLIRQISCNREGSVAVVDERGELFPYLSDEMCFQPGTRTDVIRGCKKSPGN